MNDRYLRSVGRPWRRTFWGCAIALSLGLPFLATPVQAQSADKPAAQIYTRAKVQSLPSRKAGEEALIRLKISPRKLPFTTLAFQVRNTEMVKDLAVGDDVAFRSERLDGANVLVAIRKVDPCRKFQPCPPITE